MGSSRPGYEARLCLLRMARTPCLLPPTAPMELDETLEAKVFLQFACFPVAHVYCSQRKLGLFFLLCQQFVFLANINLDA
ncbi:hypothetical protein F7D73_11725 [Prevotella copri]|uniref:Uncharacterized protein n=1 Tax=Segatella copri TaxID=165179 RepID=A0A6G1U220_9BACT|nr:hypothetical protein [Segatella copri]MQN81602.1 hypothetical protein [Segatella copri]